MLVPTRELAVQVHHALSTYAGAASLRIMEIFGGVGMGRNGQKRAMLTHVLRQEAASQALVFCKTKRGSDRVGEHLESRRPGI